MTAEEYSWQATSFGQKCIRVSSHVSGGKKSSSKGLLLPISAPYGQSQLFVVANNVFANKELGFVERRNL